MNCCDCVYNYYEPDTNFWECTNPEYRDMEEAEQPECPCSHQYTREDAKADAKYGRSDHY